MDQDLLRERQNHIEQLMIERDVDREEANSQALNLQKNISELNNKVCELERDLQAERKKSEDLQCLIDEAQFCGEELNAQTQIYVEKIQELERQMNEKPADVDSPGYAAAVYKVKQEAEEKIKTMTAKHDEQAKMFATQIVKIQDEDRRLKEKVEHLQQENELLLQQLKRKEDIRDSPVQEELDKMTAQLQILKDETDRQRMQSQDQHHRQMIAKDEEIERLSMQLAYQIKSSQNSGAEFRDSLASERQLTDARVNQLAEEVESLKEKLEAKHSSLQDLLKTQTEQIEENIRLDEELNALKAEKTALAENLTAMTKEFEKLNETHENLTAKMSEALATDDERQKLIKSLEESIEKLKAETKKALAEAEQKSQEGLAKMAEQDAQIQQLNESLQKAMDELAVECARRSDQEKVLEQTLAELGANAVALEAADQALKTASLKNDEVVESCHRLEQELKESTATAELQRQQMAKLGAEAATLDAQLTVAEARVKAYESQVQELTENGADAVEALRKDMMLKDERLEAMEKEALRQELALSEALMRQDMLQAKYNVLAGTNEATEPRPAKRESHTNDAENLTPLDALRGRVDTLTQELLQATENHFNAAEQLKQEQKRCKEQEQSLGEMREQVTALDAKCAALEAEIERRQDETKALHAAFTEAQALIEKNKVDSEKKKLIFEDMDARSNAERLSLLDTITELRQQVREGVAEIDALRYAAKESLEERAQIQRMHHAEREAMQSSYVRERAQINDEHYQKCQMLTTRYQQEKAIAEQTIARLETVVATLQEQLEMLQAELLKSQISFSEKEEELVRHNAALTQLQNSTLKAIEMDKQQDASKFTTLQEENSTLVERLASLEDELNAGAKAMKAKCEEHDQLLAANQAAISEAEQLETKMQSLQQTLDNTKEELEHKVRLIDADRAQIKDMQNMILSLKTSHERMSETNAQLSEAMQHMEEDKLETANIFELFELEADQNIEKLAEKLADMKREKLEAQQAIEAQANDLAQAKHELKKASVELTKARKAVEEQKSLAEENAQLVQTLQANQSDIESCAAKKDEQCKALQAQLEDYKKSSGGDSLDAKPEEVAELKRQIELLEGEKVSLLKYQKELVQKIEARPRGQQPDIEALQKRIAELETLMLEPLQTDNGTASLNGADSTAQINFLNSIIADMQKKNDTLKAKIEALEALPTDLQVNPFEVIAKRRPAPRVFCDICDVFDKHETEDCPLQESDERDVSPPALAATGADGEPKERKLPPPRDYCENCEVFGHKSSECAGEEFY